MINLRTNIIKLKFVFSALLLSACGQKGDLFLSSEQDANNCSSTGQTFSILKNKCVQIFDIADIHFTDPQNPTLSVYVILSDDKQRAEVFAADFVKPLLMTAVKGGFVSDDDTWRLQNRNGQWHLVSR